MSEENLAEMTGMDVPNLSNIERGKKFVGSETLSKLALALDIPESTLFDFGHKKSKEDLIKEINSIMENVSIQKLEFIYKTAINLNSID